jgi:hypothetical protein
VIPVPDLGRARGTGTAIRRPLGWIATEADGSFRRWRLVAVAVTALLAIGLATTAWPEAGPREDGGFDLELVEAGGPATVTAVMDTRGSPFRIDAPTKLGLPSRQGLVGPDFELVVFLGAGRAPVTIGLTDPRGDAVWQRVVQPGDRTQLHRRLADGGLWRFRFTTSDVRDLFAHVAGSFVVRQPFLEREGAPWVLAWLGLAITALIAAPFRRVGAAIAGFALLPLGPLAAFGVWAGTFRVPFGAAVTAGAVVAVAAGTGLALGWSRPRGRGGRGELGKLGGGTLVVAVVALLPSSFWALDGIGLGVSYLVGAKEEYGTAIALLVFGGATAISWLGSLLVGLGTAPRRREPPAGEREQPQVLPKPLDRVPVRSARGSEGG